MLLKQPINTDFHSQAAAYIYFLPQQNMNKGNGINTFLSYCCSAGRD